MGACTFALYLGGLWSYQLHKTRWFLYLAAGILGLGASLLWTAQGALMMALPEEKQKGRAYTISWSIVSGYKGRQLKLADRNINSSNLVPLSVPLSSWV